MKVTTGVAVKGINCCLRCIPGCLVIHVGVGALSGLWPLRFNHMRFGEVPGEGLDDPCRR